MLCIIFGRLYMPEFCRSCFTRNSQIRDRTTYNFPLSVFDLISFVLQDLHTFFSPEYGLIFTYKHLSGFWLALITLPFSWTLSDLLLLLVQLEAILLSPTMTTFRRVASVHSTTKPRSFSYPSVASASPRT